MAVSLKPEQVFKIGDFAVTNSMLSVSIITILVILFITIYTSRIGVNPRSRFQLLIESLVTGFNDLAISIMGKKATKTFFPFILTFFLLIIVSNWFGLMPWSGSIGYAKEKEGSTKSVPILVIGESSSDNQGSLLTTSSQTEQIPNLVNEETSEIELAEKSNAHITNEQEIHTPFFRSPSADLNFTAAMALISFFLIQYAGMKNLGLEYLGKFFDYRVSIPNGWKIILLPFTFVLNIFWKTLELVLELGKIISFTFRLFGNIFAGEVLLFVMTSLTFGLATLPFLGLEIFVGFIQAIVFIFLTMVFIKVSSESHEHHAEEANAF